MKIICLTALLLLKFLAVDQTENSLSVYCFRSICVKLPSKQLKTRSDFTWLEEIFLIPFGPSKVKTIMLFDTT